jgi:hypothetical protein
MNCMTQTGDPGINYILMRVMSRIQYPSAAGRHHVGPKEQILIQRDILRGQILRGRYWCAVYGLLARYNDANRWSLGH